MRKLSLVCFFSDRVAHDKTFAISGIVMAPIESFLNASEIETAKELLSTKPPTIHQDLFDTTKEQIFSGVPQIEFLLVSTQSLGISRRRLTGCY